jgi:putative transposase
MSQSLTKILLHIVFSTKERNPFLKDEIVRSEMYAYMAGICHKQKSHALLIGGVADHVHLLCQLHSTCATAVLIKEIKRSSSLWIKEMGSLLSKFSWQAGYGAFSIGQSQVEELKQYIANQDQHHERVTFQDEFREFLRRYEIEFDERYVWD